MVSKYRFRIGQHEVIPSERTVSGPDDVQKLEPKAMAVLVELASNAGNVVSREALVQAVWPRGHVTDDVLTRCVANIRKALGDPPKNPSYLETIPRVGYRLVEAVEVGEEAAVSTASSNPRIIVLPLQTISADTASYVADGITELLTARLAGVRELSVISRTTAMHLAERKAGLAEIAKETRASMVIEGSVVQSGNEIQIVVQLIEVESDEHLWTYETYSTLTNLLHLQNELATKICRNLQIHIGVAEPINVAPQQMNSETALIYLHSRQQFSFRTRDALASALEGFAQVNAANPEFALGWASKAEVHFMRALYGHASLADEIDECKICVSRALAVDPDIYPALTVRGALAYAIEWEFEAARKDLMAALYRCPSYPFAMLSLANLEAALGNFSQARVWMDQALAIDPLDVGMAMNSGDHYMLSGAFSAAVAAFKRALELNASHRPSQLRLAWALACEHNSNGALAALNEAGPAGPDDWQWFEYASIVCGALSMAEAAQHYGSLKEVAASQPVSSWSLARSAASADNWPEASSWLRSARAERNVSLVYAAVSPVFAKWRAEAEFQALAPTL